MKLPAYPRTKPSGVEWLGDVPEDWDVKRSDAIVSADRSQLSPEKFADGDVFHYSIPVVQETGTGQIENGESIASAKQVIKKPVVLVSKLNPRKATICLAKPQGMLTLCSTEFVALNADKCELGFLEYLTRSELFRQGLDSKVQSVTRSHQRANPADIYKFWNAWPTLADQRAIAAFLDRETGRVDRLVAKKRELIERLKEKRTALISRTVTQGLPPAPARAAGLPEGPAFKDWEIPWLDKVPEHWSVLPFRRVTTRVDVGIAEAATHAYADEGVPLVRSTNIKFESVDTSDLLFIDEEFARRLQSKALLTGDIVTTRTGANLGVSAIIPDSLHMAQCFTLLISTLTPDCDVRFYNAFINADPGKTYFAMASLGAGQHNISVPILKEMPTVRPPLPEQVAITAYLDKETAKLDALVVKVEEAVERLQEYRTALITAAVTGKIDVRVNLNTITE